MIEVVYFVTGLLIGAGMSWVLVPVCQGFVQGWSEVRRTRTGGVACLDGVTDPPDA